jgi:hypothetical protein
VNERYRSKDPKVVRERGRRREKDDVNERHRIKGLKVVREKGRRREKGDKRGNRTEVQVARGGTTAATPRQNAGDGTEAGLGAETEPGAGTAIATGKMAEIGVFTRDREGAKAVERGVIAGKIQITISTLGGKNGRGAGAETPAAPGMRADCSLSRII